MTSGRAVPCGSRFIGDGCLRLMPPAPKSHASSGSPTPPNSPSRNVLAPPPPGPGSTGSRKSARTRRGRDFRAGQPEPRDGRASQPMPWPSDYHEHPDAAAQPAAIEAEWTFMASSDGVHVVLPDGRMDLIVAFRGNDDSRVENLKLMIVGPAQRWTEV